MQRAPLYGYGAIRERDGFARQSNHALEKDLRVIAVAALESHDVTTTDRGPCDHQWPKGNSISQRVNEDMIAAFDVGLHGAPFNLRNPQKEERDESGENERLHKQARN